MRLIILLAVLGLSSGAKLNRTYLPPHAQKSGSLSEFLETPKFDHPSYDVNSNGLGRRIVGLTKSDHDSVPKPNGLIQDADSFSVNSNIYIENIAFVPNTNGLAGNGDSFSIVDNNGPITAFDRAGNSLAPNENHFKEVKNFVQNSIGLGQNNKHNFHSIASKKSQGPDRPQAEFERIARLLRLTAENDGEVFSYTYNTHNGISAREKGVAANGVETKGGSSYIGDDGKVYSIRYTAGRKGFVPYGDDLPTPPPVSREILQALARNDRDEAVFDDGFNQFAYGNDMFGIGNNGNGFSDNYTYNGFNPEGNEVELNYITNRKFPQITFEENYDDTIASNCDSYQNRQKPKDHKSNGDIAVTKETNTLTNVYYRKYPSPKETALKSHIPNIENNYKLTQREHSVFLSKYLPSHDDEDFTSLDQSPDGNENRNEAVKADTTRQDTNKYTNYYLPPVSTLEPERKKQRPKMKSVFLNEHDSIEFGARIQSPRMENPENQNKNEDSDNRSQNEHTVHRNQDKSAVSSSHVYVSPYEYSAYDYKTVKPVGRNQHRKRPKTSDESQLSPEIYLPFRDLSRGNLRFNSGGGPQLASNPGFRSSPSLNFGGRGPRKPKSKPAVTEPPLQDYVTFGNEDHDIFMHY